MANVAHSGLTGADLHEPKAIAAAAANKVYVSDGAGSGTWQKITSAQQDASANAFGAGLYHVRDVQATGVAGQALTRATWNTCRLNTEATDEITSSALASNQISLPAGTYFVDALIPVYGTGAATGADLSVRAKCRIQNITAGTTLVEGQSLHIGYLIPEISSTVFNTLNPTVRGRFTLSGTATIEFQVYPDGASLTYTGGKALSVGSEIYADVLIFKVA